MSRFVAFWVVAKSDPGRAVPIGTYWTYGDAEAVRRDLASTSDTDQGWRVYQCSPVPIPVCGHLSEVHGEDGPPETLRCVAEIGHAGTHRYVVTEDD